MMISIDFEEKDLYFVVLALDAYNKILENDEEDPGPSMMDSYHVSFLAKKLRQTYIEKTGKK